MTLTMTVDFKTSKCVIYVLTSCVCAGKGCIREHHQAANIFTQLGFGILILYITWPPNTLLKSTVEQVMMAMLMFRIRYWNLY